MRDSALIGTTSMLAKPSAVGSLARRRPSTSTSVRFTPRPRRLMLLPAPAFEGVSDSDCGSVIIRSASVVIPRCTNSSALTVVTEDAASVARCLMLEPVTSMRSGAAACGAGAG